MARSFDIASFDPSDGILNEQLRRKLNGNFSRLCAMIGTESPTVVKGDLTDAIRDWTAKFVADYFSAHVDQIVERAVDQALDDAYPVGSIVVTASSSDPRLSHGTWEQVGGGRYVRAAGGGVAALEEGGSSEVGIGLSNLPAHTHAATATASTAGSHTHEASCGSAGGHSHDMSASSDGSHSGTSTVSAGGSRDREVPTKSAGAHTHAIEIEAAGSHSHTVSVTVKAGGGSDDPRPIGIEPEYVALLFYRRVA